MIVRVVPDQSGLVAAVLPGCCGGGRDRGLSPGSPEPPRRSGVGSALGAAGGEAGDVVVHEEDVRQDRGQAGEHRARHQPALVIDVPLDEARHRAGREELLVARDDEGQRVEETRARDREGEDDAATVAEFGPYRKLRLMKVSRLDRSAGRLTAGLCQPSMPLSREGSLSPRGGR